MPSWMPEFVTAQFITSMVVIFLMLNLFLGAAMYLVLLERKISAWVQDRCGPNRVGPFGLLQPVADSLKLIFKEEFMPRGVDKVLFILAPGLTVLPAMIGFAILPWGGTLDLASIPFFGLSGEVKIIGADINIGIVYLIAVASLGVYGVSLGGWASNNKYSFLGGLRASCQMISYEIPMGLCLLCVILAAGSVRPYEIVAQQLAGGEWFIIHLPIVAILFFVCLLAETNRAPFDLAEAEQELIGGWHTEYSSLKWALFFMGEYIHMVVGGAFFTLLFLGGWSLNPLGVGWDLPMNGGILMILLQFGVILGKVFALVFLVMMIRWTLPRFRFDQLMRLAWEGMIPTTMLLLMMTSLFVYLGWLDYLWLGSLGALVVIYFVRPLMPRQANPNHRVPLIGSRFSPLIDSESSGIDEIDTRPARPGV
ncbi:MAG: NADH-quinone oxidoreductase subunit NuoH [Planctomycetes bacterium]|nr:NADH-quinone oxidoreductase subunit NuoH [Planctomycetota bacterium]